MTKRSNTVTAKMLSLTTVLLLLFCMSLPVSVQGRSTGLFSGTDTKQELLGDAEIQSLVQEAYQQEFTPKELYEVQQEAKRALRLESKVAEIESLDNHVADMVVQKLLAGNKVAMIEGKKKKKKNQQNGGHHNQNNHHNNNHNQNNNHNKNNENNRNVNNKKKQQQQQQQQKNKQQKINSAKGSNKNKNNNQHQEQHTGKIDTSKERKTKKGKFNKGNKKSKIIMAGDARKLQKEVTKPDTKVLSDKILFSGTDTDSDRDRSSKKKKSTSKGRKTKKENFNKGNKKSKHIMAGDARKLQKEVTNPDMKVLNDKILFSGTDTDSDRDQSSKKKKEKHKRKIININDKSLLNSDKSDSDSSSDWERSTKNLKINHKKNKESKDNKQSGGWTDSDSEEDINNNKKQQALQPQQKKMEGKKGKKHNPFLSGSESEEEYKETQRNRKKKKNKRRRNKKGNNNKGVPNEKEMEELLNDESNPFTKSKKFEWPSLKKENQKSVEFKRGSHHFRHYKDVSGNDPCNPGETMRLAELESIHKSIRLVSEGNAPSLTAIENECGGDYIFDSGQQRQHVDTNTMFTFWRNNAPFRNRHDSEMKMLAECKNDDEEVKEYWSAWSPCVYCIRSLLIELKFREIKPMTIYIGALYRGKGVYDANVVTACLGWLYYKGFSLEPWDWRVFANKFNLQGDCAKMTSEWAQQMSIKSNDKATEELLHAQEAINFIKKEYDYFKPAARLKLRYRCPLDFDAQHVHIPRKFFKNNNEFQGVEATLATFSQEHGKLNDKEMIELKKQLTEPNNQNDNDWQLNLEKEEEKI